MDRIARFQNALLRPNVPELVSLHLRPELDHMGRPVVVAGNNALVARLVRRDGRQVALRVVDNPRPGGDWLLRHTALQQSLPAPVRRRLPAGIRVVRGGSFADVTEASGPVAVEPGGAIAMEWVDGPTLMQAVDRAARAGNAAVLRALATSLRSCLNALAAESFVHGDLTAHNLIVRTDGTVIAVDLDSVAWPGLPLGTGGVGSAPYRHPAAVLTGPLRDGFASLVLVASLAVLGDDPDLRRSFGDPVSAPDGALLFSPWDLQDPGTSQAFAEAFERVGGEAAAMLRTLARACHATPEELRGLLSTVPRLVLGATAGDDTPVSDTTWQLGAAVDRIRARFGTATVDAPAPREPDPVAYPEWTTSLADAEATEPEPPLDRTRRRDVDEERRRLAEALDREDDGEVAWLWERLADDPVARLERGRVEDVLAGGYGRRIEHEMHRGHDEQVIALADEASERRLPLPPGARSAARLAQERRQVRADLDLALDRDDTDALVDLAVSGRLVVLGDADRSALQRVLRAIERPILDRALASNDDRIIINAYDPVLFDGDLSIGREARERIELAGLRDAWVGRVRTALRQRRVGDLFELFTNPPEGGPERLGVAERRRIRREIERRRALDELAEAVKGEDDAAIIAALNKVERVGARIGDRFTWGAIQRVVERVSVIEDLVDAAGQRPIDHVRVAQLLSVVRSLGLTGDPRLTGDLAVDTLQEHVVRFAHVRRLRAALQRDNDVAIVVAAVPDPHGALDELTEDERDRVAAAIMARRAADRPFVDARVAL